MKIRPLGVQLFYADGRTDGQTDVMKIIIAFCNSANAPKKHTHTSVLIYVYNIVYIYIYIHIHTYIHTHPYFTYAHAY